MSAPSVGWERIRDVYYRNRELYSLDWDLDVLPTLCAISKMTRTIAMFHSIDDQRIEIYTSSSHLIASIPWNPHISGRVVGLTWFQEQLCVLLANGRIRWYYTFEGDFDEFEIGWDAHVNSIDNYAVTRRGIAVLLSSGDLIKMNRLGKVQKLMNCSHLGALRDWCVIQDSIIASFDLGVYKIDNDLTLLSSEGPFDKICASANGKLVAMWNNSGLTITTASFTKPIMQWSATPMLQMEWSGDDAVALRYQDSVKLVAPGGELEFYVDDVSLISTELDGLTILTTNRLTYLSKVPSATVDCFKIGSRAKSAILIDALEKLARYSPKTSENLEIIGDGLFDAVKECIDASTEEFDPYWQKKLLKAASFGKAELEMRQSSPSSTLREIVNICDELRIINVVRDADIGLFLTYKEFKTIGITKLIDLLVKRQKFAQSYQISLLCKLPLDPVFISWACSKIKYSNTNDEKLSQEIISKFQSLKRNRYISFAPIATVAFQEGRLNLTKILINFETLFTKQIPLLLQMEENELALQKAVDSQDIDLIMETLFTLKSSLSYPQFFKLLNNSKTAANVFEYFHRNDNSTLHDFYNQADRVVDLSNFEMESNSYNNSSLQEAMDIYHTRDASVNKILDRQMALNKIQDELTGEFNIEFKGKSLSQTILTLLMLSQHSKVNEVVKMFKFNDKKLSYLKLEHYCSTKRWDELFNWLQQGKHGLPPSKVIDKCIANDEKRLALKLLTTLNVGYDDKVEFLFRLKEWRRIIDEASKKRDGATLDRLGHMNIDDPILAQSLQDAKTRVSTGSRFF